MLLHSVLDEILKFRKKQAIEIDYSNSNRYRLVINEADGSKTAYCFSIPIYNLKKRTLVGMKFHYDNDICYYEGSNSKIIVNEDIIFENDLGVCKIKNSGLDIERMSPTVNGIVLKIPYDNEKEHSFIFNYNGSFDTVRANDKCFSLMSSEFKPFITISCIGTLDEAGNLIAPCKRENQKLNESDYKFTIKSDNHLGKYLMYEINLHEEKLFQDTTVENYNPTVNNAFGGVAFLGFSPEFGRQWLYTRPMLSLIPELRYRIINKMIWHIPNLNDSAFPISAYKLSRRFCSFGTNWDNKIISEEKDSVVSTLVRGYHDLDITYFMTDKDRYLSKTEGMILRLNKEECYGAIPTGDSFYSPQILEVNFK